MVRKTKDTVAETSEFRSLSKIHPVAAEDSLYLTVRNLRSIFYSVCTIRDKSSITSSLFEKLMQRRVIKQQGLMKVDLSLAFQQGAGGARFVNFL